MTEVNKIPMDKENYGLSHGDPNKDNIMVGINEEITLIDYDIIGMGYIYQDLSYLITNFKLRFDKVTYAVAYDLEIKKLIDPFLMAYIEERKLDISLEIFKDRLRLFRVLNFFHFTLFSFLYSIKNKTHMPLYPTMIACKRTELLFKKYFK